MPAEYRVRTTKRVEVPAAAIHAKKCCSSVKKTEEGVKDASVPAEDTGAKTCCSSAMKTENDAKEVSVPTKTCSSATESAVEKVPASKVEDTGSESEDWEFIDGDDWTVLALTAWEIGHTCRMTGR